MKWMEVAFKINKENLGRAKDALLKDEVVSRASVLFKEAKSLGMDDSNYYCYVSGLEEACERAKELMKDLGEIVKEGELEMIKKKIKEEEESAMEGFGSIFE